MSGTGLERTKMARARLEELVTKNGHGGPQPGALGTVLADVAPQRVEWLSVGRLARGKTTILDGDPGLGKSTVALDWAARITRGDPLPDGPKLPPRGVILLSAEDDPADTIRPRADVAGADVSKVLILTERADGSLLSIPNDLAEIEAAINRIDAALLVIDPLMAFIDGTVNANRDQDIRRAMAPVRAMAERSGVAVLVIRHLTKGGGDNAIYRGGGSIGIIGAARFGLIVGADPDDPSRALIASSKCNLARKPDTIAYRLESVPGTDVARVAWDGVSAVNAAGLLAAADTHDDSDDDRDEVRAWLRDFLSLGPRPADDVLREGRRAGFGEKSVRRAKAAISVRSTKSGFGQEGRWSWALPDHELPETPKTDEDAVPDTLAALGTLGNLRHLSEPPPIDSRHNDDDFTKVSAKTPNTPNTPNTPDTGGAGTLAIPDNCPTRERCVAKGGCPYFQRTGVCLVGGGALNLGSVETKLAAGDLAGVGVDLAANARERGRTPVPKPGSAERSVAPWEAP